jgi:ADP-ribose pyrophosphatase
MTDPDAALAVYDNLRTAHPELFVNPPDAAHEIVFEPELQRVVGAGVMYRDAYYMLLRDAVRFRDGSVCPYIRLVPTAGHGGAAVLPLLDASIVLIRHFRHATRASHWEIPRGFAQSGEPPEETARRELSEELGVPAPKLYDLGSVHPDTGASNVCTRLYLARLTSLGQIEANEGIDEVRLVTPSEFDIMVRAGQITDSFTLAAALQARLRGLLG